LATEPTLKALDAKNKASLAVGAPVVSTLGHTVIGADGIPEVVAHAEVLMHHPSALRLSPGRDPAIVTELRLWIGMEGADKAGC
jgi:hypothetical protein